MKILAECGAWKPAAWVAAVALLALPTVSQAAPKAEIKPATIELGEIEEGGEYERYVELTNTGDGVLTLEDVKTSCGCTAAAVDSDVELKSGETQKIRVSFNSRNMEGGVTKKVTVKTNDPENPSIEIVLKANVHRSVKWEPRYVSFNQVGLGEEAEQVVTLEADKNLDLQVSEAYVRGGLRGDKDSKLFSVEISERRSGEERDAYDLTVRMADKRKPQRISESLIIVTNIADKDTVKIPVRGEVSGRISFSPSYAVLALVNPGEETTRDVMLSASDGTFKILNASVPESPVRAEIVPDEQPGRYTVRLTYVGEETGANGVKQLRVETDDPDQAVIEIPVRYQTRVPAGDSGVATKGPGN
ncbi:MAG TPA: DUF1573 domain-containing protein [bacterium]|nr:DUF1573 domain-containing protein [bacterium]